jgi:hypothetical protein
LCLFLSIILVKLISSGYWIIFLFASLLAAIFTVAYLFASSLYVTARIAGKWIWKQLNKSKYGPIEEDVT